MIDPLISKLRMLLGCLAAAFGSLVLPGCEGGDPTDDGEFYVVATTGMVGDMVTAIAGDGVEVEVLMGPGIDPHSFTPKMKDTGAMTRADLIFYSGLMLEGTMEKQWSSHSKKSHGVTSAVPEDRLKGDADHPDPHVWGDVSLWASGVDVVVEAFSKYDPDNAAAYKQRGEEYRKRLADLHEWALLRATEVPEANRVMITSHDAFEYFGEAYGFKVYGLQGISTVGSFGAGDRAALADVIRKLKVKMIFPESSVNPAAIKGVAEDTGVAVSETELFSDAMGVPGETETVDGETYDVGTFEGMIKHNMNALVEGLK